MSKHGGCVINNGFKKGDWQFKGSKKRIPRFFLKKGASVLQYLEKVLSA